MIPALTPVQFEQLQIFVSSLSRDVTFRAEKLLDEDQLENLAYIPEDSSFHAEFTNSVARLLFQNGKWIGRCNCRRYIDCEHICALATRMLEDFAPKDAGAKEPQISAALENLDEKAIEVALERKLAAHERRYLRKLHQAWNRFGINHEVTMWDLYDLGHPSIFGRPGKDMLLPIPPKNPLQFWLHIAFMIEQHRGSIAAFLKPFTDYGLIAEALAEKERREQIAAWESALHRLEYESPLAQQIPLDFRLVLARDEARLESRTDEKAPFEALKKGRAKQLLLAYSSGKVAVLPEASALCEALGRDLTFGWTPWNIENPEFQNKLKVLLRIPSLNERIVNAQAVPFRRASDELKWQIEPVANAPGDYQLRLSQPPDPSAGNLLMAVDGHPPLYVFENAIYPGPILYPFLDVSKPRVIPEPVVHSAAGIDFLMRLGVDLPAQLQERIEHIPLRVTIACELNSRHPENNAEYLEMQVGALTPDGRMAEEFSNSSWIADEKQNERRKKKSGKIVVLGRQGLEAAPALVEALGVKWDWYRKRWTRRTSKNFPEKFVAWLNSLPADVELRLDPVLKSLLEKPLSGTIQLDCTENEIDWFDLRVTLNVSDTQLTPEEIKLLLNARGQYVRLKNKGWQRLQIETSQADDEALARLGLSASEFSAEPQRLHALQLADEAAAKFLSEERAAQIRRRAGEIKTRVTPTLPEGVMAQLRPYQLDGFHFLAYLATNRFGGILADDMGLGKTLQTLTWLAWLRSESGQKILPSIVVCPKSVMETWLGEAARFVPSLRVKLWRGSDASLFRDTLAEADLLVLNYAQLRALGDDIAKVQWQAAILDEGQYIKNPDSQTAQVARALKAEYRIALSGTPIENRLMDLWSLMAFAMPGVLGNRAQFGRNFNVSSDVLARRRLAARVRPFLLRRTKSQVAKDLPERTEEDLLCELETEQKTLYRAEFKHAQQMLLNVKTTKELNEFRFHFLTSLLRLRQICCHPGLISPEFRKAESAKLAACMDLLEPLMAEDHKVLVFSQFVSMLGIIREAVEARNWPHFYLAGDTENRGELVEDFQNSKGGAIFLLSLKAGGFGLNLTAASYVVLFDPWWNPAVENQAIDRTHRIGQTRNVTAYRLLIKDSIEQKIRALQQKKSALAEDILGEESFGKSLTLDDLRFLFSEPAAPGENR